MEETHANLYGELRRYPRKKRLAKLLANMGFDVYVGRYSVRIPHFVFREYGGLFPHPVIDADADSVEILSQETKRLSEALTQFDLAHRFEIYNHNDQLVAYFHHQWPMQA